MDDLRIRLKTEADSSTFNSSVKQLESQAPTVNIKARIESVTGIAGLSGKSAKASGAIFEQFRKATVAADDFQVKLNNLKTTGGLTQQQFDDFNEKLTSLRKNLNSGEMSIEDFYDGMHQLKNEVSEASTATKAMGQSLTDIISKFTKWYLISGLVTGVINLIKNMVSVVIELDTAMVELNKVFDASEQELADVQEKAFTLASQLGSTGLAVINATTEFKRMGYTIDESLDLARVAVMLTNVAEGLSDSGEAASILTSIMKGLGVGAEYAESILDRLNEVSNNNAVSLATLADMAQRASATMNILGNTFDQTLALLTGAYEVLQDERVAKGIQTVGLRIAGLNEDLETQVGLSNQVVNALQKYAGINAFDEQTGQIRSTYDILDELATKWDQLNINTQNTLTNILGGKERADVVAALMTNWQGVADAIKDAENSAGSARAEQEAYLKSIIAELQNAKNAFMNLAQELIPAELVKSVVSLLTSVLKLVTPIATVVGWFIKIAQLARGIDYVSQIISFVGETLSSILSFLEPIVNLVHTIMGFLMDSAWSAFKVILDGISFVINSIKSSLEGVVDVISDIINWVKNAGEEVALFFDSLFGGSKKQQKDLAETFEKQKKEYNSALQALKNNLNEQKESAQEYLNSLKEQNEELNKEKNLNDKILAVEKARQELAEAKNKRVRVFRAGIGFAYESDVAEVQSAQEKLDEAISTLSEYKYDLELERAEEFVNKFQEILSGDDMLGGWENLLNNFSDLLDTEFADYLNEAKKFVEDFNKEFGKLGEEIKSKENISNGDSEYTGPIIKDMVGNKSGIGGGGGRAWANGTTNAPAGLNLVGEEGPELRVLNQGDGIISANLTRNLMSFARNPKLYTPSNGCIINFNGALNFPNVTNGDDAQAFIDGVMAIGASKIPKYN